MTGLGSSCGACKFLRRKCTSECVFAPYFCYDEAAMHFAAVHKVFGASNVSKLLMHLPVHNRGSAAMTISYEALARMSDPVYGCVAQIFALQQQISSLQEEIDILGSQIAGHPTRYSRESSNATNDCLITQQDALNGKDCWHQGSEPFVNAADTTLEQVINSQLNSELLPPPCGWQDESILHGFGMRNSERFAEEMEQEMLLQYYNSVGELLNGPI